jgi:hypothetical protein
MTEQPAAEPPAGARPDREARLKAALKANIARRKAQARARADELSDKTPRKNED